MSSILNSKKSQIESRMAILTFLFGFGFLSIFGWFLLHEFIYQFSLTDFYSDEVASVGASFLSNIAMLDYVIVLFVVLLIIGLGITSYKLATAPVFFVVMFISAAFEGAVAYFFNYLFSQIISDAAFLSATAIFPRTILICTNLHWIALVSIIVASVTLYGKKEKGQFLG